MTSPVKRFFIRMGLAGLSVGEKAFQSGCELRFSPVFLVAPPRAGTTVTRQLIDQAIPTSYFSNFAYRALLDHGKPLPGTSAWIVKHVRNLRYNVSFQSDYAYSPGMCSPSEAELLWGYWFGTRYDAVEPGQLSEEKKEALYAGVALTEKVFGLPFVSKSTVLSLRIRTLCEVFPSASFIQILRDPLDTAQSIFVARTRKHPVWLGARPLECKELGDLSIHEQVCRQVYYVEQSISRERRVVGEERFSSVYYRDVCEKPREVLKGMASFMERRGSPAPIVGVVPEKFPLSSGQKIDDEDYSRLQEHLAELYG